MPRAGQFQRAKEVPKFEIKKYVLSQVADKPGLGGMVSSLISFFAHFVLFRG
jgi:hypothetical protein